MTWWRDLWELSFGGRGHRSRENGLAQQREAQEEVDQAQDEVMVALRNISQCLSRDRRREEGRANGAASQ